ncbi:MAG: transglycosylase domain-containing protein [Bacteroidota bacterium]
MSQTIPILRGRRDRRLSRLRRRSARTRAAVISAGMVLSLALAGLILGAALGYADLTRGLPSVESLPRLLSPPDGMLLQPTRVYDRTGQHVLLSFGLDESPRAYLALNEENPQHLAPELASVVVALADPGFWRHSGYAINGWQDPSLHPTIAERLVSDLLLYDEKPSIRRALRERILAAQATARFGRSQILEWYLNSADFGEHAFGAEAAAQLYFGKSAGQLSLAESAVLAAVSEAPALNPLEAPQAALERGRQVIEELRAEGMLTEEQASKALAARVRFTAQPPPATPGAEAFINLALAQLESRFSRARIERGGLSIFTTLDYDLQQQASCTTEIYARRLAGLAEPEAPCDTARFLPALPSGAALAGASASALVLDPASGQVLAAVGETLEGKETPLLAAHEPGSLLDPFIYLTGFTRGLSPASLLWDIPGLVDVQNYDGRYHGPVRLRIALANDYRVPAEWVRRQMGPENLSKTTDSFGLSLDAPLHLLEVAGAYGALGMQGVYYGQEFGNAFGPAAILRVEAADGAIWLDWSSPEARPVVSAGLAYLLTNVLSDEPSRWPSLGSPNLLEIGRPAAVKLGQLPDKPEGWAAGYTPARVVVTWTGARGPGRLSTRSPAVLWSALMHAVSQDQPRRGWGLPEGLSVMDVCDPSGQLPTADCPNVVSEVFLQGSEPTQADSLFRAYQVNRETGYLATVFTPPQLVEKRVYMIVPPEAKVWAQEAGLPVPPESYDAIQPPAVNPDANLTAPALFADVQGVVRIAGTASGADFDHYRIQVGKGLNPQEWIQVGDDQHSPVENGLLAEWNTEGLSGLYAVQLLVVRTDQRVDTAVTQVTVKAGP